MWRLGTPFSSRETALLRPVRPGEMRRRRTAPRVRCCSMGLGSRGCPEEERARPLLPRGDGRLARASPPVWGWQHRSRTPEMTTRRAQKSGRRYSQPMGWPGAGGLDRWPRPAGEGTGGTCPDFWARPPRGAFPFFRADASCASASGWSEYGAERGVALSGLIRGEWFLPRAARVRLPWAYECRPVGAKDRRINNRPVQKANPLPASPTGEE